MSTMFDALNRAYDKWLPYNKYREVDLLVWKLMRHVLHVDWTQYAIGGSWAMIAYGIDIHRDPHDIDVIVPMYMLETIEQLIKWCPDPDVKYEEFNGKVETSKYCRVTLRYKGRAIDILGAMETGDPLEPHTFDAIRPSYAECQVQNLHSIRYIKSKWMRPKDVEDMALIDLFLEKIKEEKPWTPKPVSAPTEKAEIDLPF